MESRFAHLRQRDHSVSMLRVKMSRRRSQAQKENRERTVNTRRKLKAVQELEVSSLDASVALANMSAAQEHNVQPLKNVAGEERLKQLQRWKERKALEKEKEKREKSRKGVFKTGLYHPKDSLLPPVLPGSGRPRETKLNAAPAQSARVTRSMRQQLVQKDVDATVKKSQPPAQRTTRPRGAVSKPVQPPCKSKAELTTRGSSTRSASRPLVTAAPVLKDKPKDKCADVRTTRSKAAEVAPPSQGKKTDDKTIASAAVEEEIISKTDIKEEERKASSHDPTLQSGEEEMAVEQPVVNTAPSSPTAASFAPEGFLFQAPQGLSSFKFDPMTPRSADAFLTPSSSFTLPSAPAFDDEPKAAERKSSPHEALVCSSPSVPAPEEPKHDVPYFRSEIANETARLTGLGDHWESKVEDESIPEEMRDCMRTVIGQARLLIKERFNQFGGLVDDCEFSRSEKIVTCTDLQGFWDMVYFQVEDVNKKFDALKGAEARGWVEELRPPARQKKAKKAASAPGPAKPAGTNAAAKSRLAAAKAAMKARQQAAESERASQAEGVEQSLQEMPLKAKSSDPVMIRGGVFQADSSTIAPASARRSSRLSAMVPQSPPSNHLTPRRMTRQSLALAVTPGQTSTNPQPTTPFQPYPVNKTPAQSAVSNGTPQTRNAGVVLRCSPVKDAPEQAEDCVSDTAQLIPSVTVEKEDKPEEAPSLCSPQSPFKGFAEPPVLSASLSFTLSPCAAQLSSPAPCCTPQPVQNSLNSHNFSADTPQSLINEDVPGVDFELYLQPSQRDSLSPGQPCAMESPMVMDVDMESPRGQPESCLSQQEPASFTLPSEQTQVPSSSPQTAESALLLFTPDFKDRIRQSVCPSDLMVFTPPL